MLHKISNTRFTGHGPIKILYPGLEISKEDTGIGSIGRIDHPEIHGKTVIKMHPHINDEILSYFRTGTAEHSDSEGFVKTIGKRTLMLMKAGKMFQHEEKIFGDKEPMEGLQIFIRPGEKDLKPEVVFLELDEIHSENKWRLLASPNVETDFQFSSQTWLYDARLLEENTLLLPDLAIQGLTLLLYVFKGNIIVNSDLNLEKKDSLLIKDENVIIKANQDSELVLFVTDESAEVFKEGMYSGNKL
ncbi:pirin family protein [Chryseobacterium luquanense]|uniref:Pirin family protein n=1 Tax=Chryseobacterium luquanense TaxID=2983766 RepID=A0ABT3Y7S3_9FLAO|nr:pirin family protein [Chryseobacterium luquanense]MCX8534224.1 pirin family protein [Chryseobacterium luquanense]